MSSEEVLSALLATPERKSVTAMEDENVTSDPSYIKLISGVESMCSTLLIRRIIMAGFNSENMEQRLVSSLHPDVQRRILAFANEIRDDLTHGTGLTQTYGVNSTSEAIRVLTRFEQTGDIPNRNAELVDDYLTFIRSFNIIPGV